MVEKELGWGVSPAELNHLTGRIGELYAAMVTRGQMALATNQQGYDVISTENERISVKTITSSNHVKFNTNTFDLVDRVMILRVNINEDDGVSVDTLLDCAADEFEENYRSQSGALIYGISANPRQSRPLDSLRIIREVSYKDYNIQQYENGTIVVEVEGVMAQMSKPYLREIAAEIGVDTLNNNSNAKNTRQLGADILKVLDIRNQG